LSCARLVSTSPTRFGSRCRGHRLVSRLGTAAD
jgi:hypothetical protein